MRVAALLISLGSLLAPPPPAAPLPTSDGAVVKALVTTDAAVRREIDTWPTPRMSSPPAELTLQALYEQRLYRMLAVRPALARSIYRRLPSPLRAHARDVVNAHADLFRITPPLRTRYPRLGRAAPPDDLLRWYREGQRRFAVPWNVLAAVNFVESAFGKLRSASAAGAQGPMQFMPATWRAYGLGGNI
ncbi:MAG TPA: transglycosylase SLT domain-containing protein, partial [Thermoanaerobaculia bacterium]|nr:transglycosylase SLT domain-containing protein [Thermoanaerobaculia bacterium]